MKLDLKFRLNDTTGLLLLRSYGMPRWIVAILALVSLSSPLPAQRPAYSPEQLSLIRNVSESRISPDGKTVAFVSDITGAQELWTVPTGGGWPNQLTNLNERVADIRWSPDSRWLAFISDYGGNERRDLYRVAAEGGAVEKLTDSKESESQPRFSPDGKKLAFTADPDPNRAFLFQLHVMDLATRQTVQLTREPVNILSPVWSRDGRTIAVTRSGDEQKGDLLLIDAESGAKVEVEPSVQGGILWPEAFAPDGKSLLLLARNPEGFMQLAVLDLAPSMEAGKPPKAARLPQLIGPGNWDVMEARWTRKGIIYFLVNEGGKTTLHELRSTTGRALPIALPDGVAHQLDLDETANHLALLLESVTRPADVWVLDLKAAATDSTLPLRFPQKQITFSLMGGVKAEDLATGAMVAYESFDKTKIHALVMKPRVPRLGSPPPAIVCVHGGPNGQTTLEFEPFFQALAEAGFVVIAPNYRGSTGYGKAFEDLNNKDWGGGDLKDLVAAVKHFGDQGIIDPRRVGITGGSYGGYMTLMALCKAPAVFKAGVERYGMPDLVMDYLLSKSRFADWYETEMGNPLKDAALFRERSPLPYLDSIKAPLLVFQGAGDSNVPKAESDLLVAILKELGKEHEYIVYDDEGHGFTRRKNLLDCYRRTTAFFSKHLPSGK